MAALQQSSVIVDNWVSVDDKPKEDGYYQVCMIRNTDSFRDIFKAYWNGKKFLSDENTGSPIENKFWEVTHYKKMPQLP